LKRAAQMMAEDEDEEMPGMPQPAPTNGASVTDDDLMTGNAEASDSSHCTSINGIGRGA
jgi:hypothetical protein